MNSNQDNSKNIDPSDELILELNREPYLSLLMEQDSEDWKKITRDIRPVDVRINIDSTGRDHGYGQFIIEDGESRNPLVTIYGPMAGIYTEILMKALTTTALKDHPGVLDIFERHNKQEGIERIYDKDMSRYITYVKGVRQRTVDEDHYFFLYRPAGDDYVHITSINDLEWSDQRVKSALQHEEAIMSFKEKFKTYDTSGIYMVPSGEDFDPDKHQKLEDFLKSSS